MGALGADQATEGDFNIDTIKTLENHTVMDLATSLILLDKTIGKLITLRAWLKDEMAEFLINLAESDYRSAINAFKDAKISAEPKREIAMGITCLRQSFDKFYAASFGKSGWGLGEGLLVGLTFGGYKTTKLRSAGRCIECALLLAASYRAIDDYSLVSHFVNKAKELFELYPDIYITELRQEMAGLNYDTYYENRLTEADGEVDAMRIKLVNICNVITER